MKRFLALFFAVSSSIYAAAQSTPTWVQQPPPKSSTYYYRVSKGIGLTEETAERQAFAMAIMESAIAVGIPMDIKRLGQMEADSLLVEASHYVIIPINKVCVHTESLATRRGYRAYVLCQVAINAKVAPEFKTFNCYTNQEE